jgi:hypothetical protein
MIIVFTNIFTKMKIQLISYNNNLNDKEKLSLTTKIINESERLIIVTSFIL